MRHVIRKGGGGMRTGRQKKNVNIAVWIAALCMIFLPNLISPLYVAADSHSNHHSKNKCKIVCKHRGKHGVCLVYGQDCGGNKLKKTKLYAVKPDKDKEEKDTKDKKKSSGKNTCHHSDAPHESKIKSKHMDEDCCPDPDEWENPRCDYSAKDYGVLISHS